MFVSLYMDSIKPFAQPPYTTLPAPVPPPISTWTNQYCNIVLILWSNYYYIFWYLSGYEALPPPRPAAIAAPVWQDRTIASAKLRLLEYSAFLETQRDRETVILSNPLSPLLPELLSNSNLFSSPLYHFPLFVSYSINTFLSTLGPQTPATVTPCWSL